MARAKTEQAEFTTYRRTLTKIHRWLADTPQSFMHFQAAALEYSHRVEGNTGWCTTRQSHPIPHCKPALSAQCCKPIQSVLRLRQYPPKPAKAGSGMSDPISFQFSARCIWSCSHPCLVCKCVTHLLWHCTILHQEKWKMPVCGTWLWQMPLGVPSVFSSDLEVLWLPAAC